MSSMKEALKDDEVALKMLMQGLAKFQDRFVDNMAKGTDFTIRLEVNGCKGKVNHVRCYLDEISRPERR